MKPDELLTRLEIETRRTPAELQIWIDRFLDQIGSSEQGKAWFRSRRGMAKPMAEEVIPASIYMTHQYDNRRDVFHRPVLGNQNYDAEVRDANERLLEYLECTYAIEGYDESLRAEALNSGQSPIEAIGRPKFTGKKGNRLFSPNIVAIRVTSIVQQNLSLIRKTISMKLQRSEAYSTNHVLLVAFDDELIRDQRYLDEIVQSLRSEFSGTNNAFKSVFLILSWRKRAVRLGP